MQTYKMKHLENEVKSQWHNRLPNKTVAHLKSVDARPSLVSCDAPVNEVGGKYKAILLTTEDKITKIMLNRPEKKNAINLVMYEEIMQALDEAAKDDSTLTVITGCGDYFSSGNDLITLSENVEELIKDDGKLLLKFVHHFIDFPKPLVALVNGPAIGLAAALLGLCDIVYATERQQTNTANFSESMTLGKLRNKWCNV